MPLNIDVNNVCKTVAPTGLSLDTAEFPEEEHMEMAAEANHSSAPQTVANAHHINWMMESIHNPPLNAGAVPVQMWSICSSVGEVMVSGGKMLQHKIFCLSNLLLLIW
jgi:hypothetical protein